MAVFALTAFTLTGCGLLDQPTTFPALDHVRRRLAEEALDVPRFTLLLDSETGLRELGLDRRDGVLAGAHVSREERLLYATLFLNPLLSGRYTCAFGAGGDLFVTADTGEVARARFQGPGFPSRVTLYRHGSPFLQVARERNGDEHVLRLLQEGAEAHEMRARALPPQP